jgi:hypothetical protein
MLKQQWTIWLHAWMTLCIHKRQSTETLQLHASVTQYRVLNELWVRELQQLALWPHFSGDECTIRPVCLESGRSGSCVRMLNINDAVIGWPCSTVGCHHTYIAIIRSIPQQLETADHCSIEHFICPAFAGPMQRPRACLQCLLRSLRRNMHINRHLQHGQLQQQCNSIIVPAGCSTQFLLLLQYSKALSFYGPSRNWHIRQQLLQECKYSIILILCMVQQQLIGICSILSHLDHLLPTSPGFGQSWPVEPDPIGSRCPITSSISRDHICSSNNEWSSSQGEQAVQYGRMAYALRPLALLHSGRIIITASSCCTSRSSPTSESLTFQTT